MEERKKEQEKRVRDAMQALRCARAVAVRAMAVSSPPLRRLGHQALCSAALGRA